MKPICLYLYVAFACSAGFAQKICTIPKHGPSAEAVQAFESIQTAIGFDGGAILLYTSSDPLVQDRSGAVSVVCPGGRGEERWIVFDPGLIKGDGLYFALAHETAHHLNNDSMSGDPPSRQQELRADRFAAQYLARPPLNWTSARLMQALKALPLPRDAKGLYPSIEERLQQVSTGYTEQSALLRVNTAPGPLRAAGDATPAGAVKANSKDGLMYVWIPPGQFWMGCSPGDGECFPDELPAHSVTITKGFWIGQTEVTQEAYKKVMGNEAYERVMPDDLPAPPNSLPRAPNPEVLKFKGPRLPIENVSWNDADTYCLTVGGRLPTEAEWEYAARAGTIESRYGDIGEIAWYGGDSENKTHEVGKKRANAWGVFDMLGNVSEWIAGWYTEKLSSGAIDPKGPTSGETRAVRGGRFLSEARILRASDRESVGPTPTFLAPIGVRCVADSIASLARRPDDGTGGLQGLGTSTTSE